MFPDRDRSFSGCAWWPATLPQRILADELTVHSHVLGPIRFLERSRTVHVVSNLALVVSVCCLSSRARGDRTVNVMQLERSGEGWILRDFVSREGIVPFSEKTADPR